MSHPTASPCEIRKEVVLAMLHAGYDMPPEEAGAENPMGMPQSEQSILLLAEDTARPFVPSIPANGLTLRIEVLLKPYYKTTLEARRDAWYRLAVGLSDDEWAEMWARHVSRDAVSWRCRCWVEGSKMFPHLASPEELMRTAPRGSYSMEEIREACEIDSLLRVKV